VSNASAYNSTITITAIKRLIALTPKKEWRNEKGESTGHNYKNFKAVI
jgi:hypothetical protein